MNTSWWAGGGGSSTPCDSYGELLAGNDLLWAAVAVAAGSRLSVGDDTVISTVDPP